MVSMVRKDLIDLLFKEKLDAEIQNYAPTQKIFSQWQNFIEHSFSTTEITALMSSFRYTDWYRKADTSNSLGILRQSQEE